MGHAGAETGLTEAQVAEPGEALIVTRGAEGSVIDTRGRTWTIPCASRRRSSNQRVAEIPTGLV